VTNIIGGFNARVLFLCSLRYLRSEKPTVNGSSDRRNARCDGASIALATLNWEADVWVIRPAHTSCNSDGNGGIGDGRSSVTNCIKKPPLFPETLHVADTERNCRGFFFTIIVTFLNSFRIINQTKHIPMKTDYDMIYNELLEVVPNGNTVIKVMDVLKRNGVVQGELTKPIEWIFNFNGGGWNTVRATNIEDAKKLIKAQYETLNPLYDSIRPSARADYESNMRNFD